MDSSFDTRLANFFKSGRFTDCTIKLSNGTSILAHKILLARRSHYFNALFRYSKDQRSFDFPPHLLHDRDFVQIMINRVYRIRSDPIGEDNAADLMLHADYFGFMELVELCEEAFLDCVDVSNCVTTLKFAGYFPRLEEQVVAFVAGNFEELFRRNKEFAGLPKSTVARVLSSPGLGLQSEMTVWNAVKEWVQFDAPSRLGHLQELLGLVRFGLLSHSENSRLRLEYLKLSGLPETQLLKSATTFQKWKHTVSAALPMPSLPDEMVTPRPPKMCAIATGGWTQMQPSTSIELYDCKNDMWFTPPVQLPGPRAYHGCIEMDGKVYTVGGFDGTTYYKSLFCLDLGTMVWTELPPMHFKRCYVSVVSHQGFLYVMGGYDGLNENRRLTVCERFEPATNQWTIMSNMKKSRSDASAVAHQGCIYIAGGFNGDQYLNTVERYDIAEDKWTPMKPMRQRRGGVGCALLGSHLYAMGGHDGHGRLNTVECLDLDNESVEWVKKESMTTNRSNFGICSIGGRIVVAGGYEHPTTTCKCEWFDGNQWHTGQEIGRAASALAMTTVSTAKPFFNLIKKEELLPYLQKKRESRIKLLEPLDNLFLPESDADLCQRLRDVQGCSFDICIIQPEETSIKGFHRDCRKVLGKLAGILSSARNGSSQ